MAEYGCPSRCRGECPDSDRMINVPCTVDEVFAPPGTDANYAQCCHSDISRACKVTSTMEAGDSSFRRADGTSKGTVPRKGLFGLTMGQTLIAVGAVIAGIILIKKYK